jgi:hypothetical protein
MQFYPEASSYEAEVHSGAFSRRNGELRLDSIRGPGLGYRLSEIDRPLPEPFYSHGEGSEDVTTIPGGSLGMERGTP